MSLRRAIKSIGRTVKAALPAAASMIPGVGSILGPALTARAQIMPQQNILPAMAGMGGILARLPALGRVIPGVGSLAGGAVVGTAIRGARTVARAASNYCRKHPQWCATIGGTAAIEAMINRGELPVPKRRRGRGITATELRNFKRVVKFTSKYCAPVQRARRAPALRSKSCR